MVLTVFETKLVLQTATCSNISPLFTITVYKFQN